MLGLHDLTVADLQPQRKLDRSIVLLHDSQEADFLRNSIGHVDLEGSRYSGGGLPKTVAGLHRDGVFDELNVR